MRVEAAKAVHLLAFQEGVGRALWAVNWTRILEVGLQMNKAVLGVSLQEDAALTKKIQNHKQTKPSTRLLSLCSSCLMSTHRWGHSVKSVVLTWIASGSLRVWVFRACIWHLTLITSMHTLHCSDAKVRVKAAKAIYSAAFQEGCGRALCAVNTHSSSRLWRWSRPHSAGGIQVRWHYPWRRIRSWWRIYRIINK